MENKRKVETKTVKSSLKMGNPTRYQQQPKRNANCQLVARCAKPRMATNLLILLISKLIRSPRSLLHPLTNNQMLQNTIMARTTTNQKKHE